MAQEVKYNPGDVVKLRGQEPLLTVISSSWRVTKVVWMDAHKQPQEAELPTVSFTLFQAVPWKEPEAKKPKGVFPQKFKRPEEYQDPGIDPTMASDDSQENS